MTIHRAAYLVVRVGLNTDSWDARCQPVIYTEERYQPRTDADEGSVRVPVAILTDRNAAQRERSRREATARELLNPFWLLYGDLESLTSLPEADLHERIRALGIAPPVPIRGAFGERMDWAAWWDAESPNWTAARCSAVWDALDKVKLFEVIECELE